MRAVAAAVVCMLVAPPEVTEPPEDASSVEHENPGPQSPDQQSLDCLVDGCDTGEAEVEATDPAVAESSTENPAAEALKLEGRELIAYGKHEEGIAVLEQAYQLTPGDHILAYEIASAAQEIGHCTKMRTYLAHFVQYADPNEFPNKMAKAQRALNSSSCTSTTNSEALEAATAGGYGTSNTVPANDGSGLVAGGAILVGGGIIAFVAGIALVAVGLTGTKAAVNQLEAPDPSLGNYLIAGGVIGPAGVALIAGGGVMITRGKQQSYMTLAPTGLTVRF